MSEHLDGSSLVGGNRDCVGILLNGGTCDFVGTSVVPEVDHFATLALEDPSEDTYGRIVTVENRSCGDNANGHFPI
jgi:hypothetical protein